MFSDIELTNCPDKYALNCKRYDIKCHECKANNKGKYLLYSPINKSIKNHPAESKQKTRTVSYSRKGKAQEQKTINKSQVLQRTIASGSYVGDGDAFIPMGNLGRIRVEHKTRYNNKNLFSPTSTELKEGYTQDIKVWYIVNGSKPYSKPQVFVKYNLVAKIVEGLYINKNTVPMCCSLPNNRLLLKILKGDTFNLAIEYNCIEIKRGLGLSKKNQSLITFFRFIIAKTSYGRFCFMSLDLFEKLVKHYIELT